MLLLKHGFEEILGFSQNILEVFPSLAASSKSSRPEGSPAWCRCPKSPKTSSEAIFFSHLSQPTCVSGDPVSYFSASWIQDLEYDQMLYIWTHDPCSLFVQNDSMSQLTQKPCQCFKICRRNAAYFWPIAPLQRWRGWQRWQKRRKRDPASKSSAHSLNQCQRCRATWTRARLSRSTGRSWA